MKKVLSVTLFVGLLILTLSCCEKETRQNSETTQPETTTAVEEKTTDNGTTQAAEKTYETVIIENEKYSFTIQKFDFEKNYSEDLLMEISKLVPMEFGYDDYNNWDGSPNKILNDAFFGTDSWHLERFEYESDEWNAAVAELKENTHSQNLGEYTFTNIEKINSYLKCIYGSNAREFTVDDFETYNEIKINDDSVFENYDMNFRYAYLPKTELVVCFMSEICFGIGEACYIYDIETDGEAYVVRAVTGSEEIGENIYTFEGIQGDALNMLNTYTSGVLTNYTFTVCSNKDGTLYMKSVDKSYVLPDNTDMRYRVNSDKNVNVEMKKYYSGDWEVIDTLSKNEEFYSDGHCYEEGYVWIITEEYIGRVERKHLIAIE